MIDASHPPVHPEHPAQQVHDHFQEFAGRVALLSPGEEYLRSAINTLHPAWANTVERLHIITFVPWEELGYTSSRHTLRAVAINAALTQSRRYADIADYGPLGTDDNTSQLQTTLQGEIGRVWVRAPGEGIDDSAYGIIGIVRQEHRERLLPAPYNSLVTRSAIALMLFGVSLDHESSKLDHAISLEWKQLYPPSTETP